MTTWKPLPGRGGDGPEPRPVAASLDRVAGRFGVADATLLATVFNRWEEVVGPVVAAHTRPLSLSRGVLLVAVDDPAWATQLKYLGASVVERFAELVGSDAITRLEVRVRPG